MNDRLKLHIQDEGDFFYREAIKKLRANVQFSGKKNKIIMITSVFSGEGKSEVSFHLALDMANAGKKVLYVDADIRKSVFLERYGVVGEVVGLSEFLSGQVDRVDQIVYPTEFENLFIILAGHNAPNPAEMLGDEQFNTLLRMESQRYDYVFVDTPPLGQVIDAALVGQYCDGALLILESGAASRQAALRVKDQIEKSGCRILGAVLNRVSRGSGSGYYGAKYGKYGKYGRYGKYGEYDKYGE
jgi:capsular exopolysaccharide synthesis family protein